MFVCHENDYLRSYFFLSSFANAFLHSLVFSRKCGNCWWCICVCLCSWANRCLWCGIFLELLFVVQKIYSYNMKIIEINCVRPLCCCWCYWWCCGKNTQIVIRKCCYGTWEMKWNQEQKNVFTKLSKRFAVKRWQMTNCVIFVWQFKWISRKRGEKKPNKQNFKFSGRRRINHTDLYKCSSDFSHFEQIHLWKVHSTVHVHPSE